MSAEETLCKLHPEKDVNRKFFTHSNLANTKTTTTTTTTTTITNNKKQQKNKKNNNDKKMKVTVTTKTNIFKEANFRMRTPLLLL
jgi:hypothetical protein